MGVNCCNRRLDDNGKMTVMYSADERKINDIADKAKSHNEVTVAETNNESVITVINDQRAKYAIVIQSWFQGIKLRIIFKKSLQHSLRTERESFLKTKLESLQSVYEKNLSKLDVSGYNPKHIYFDEKSGTKIRLFASFICNYDLENVNSLYKGELCSKVKRHGYGVHYYKNNSFYEGYWKLGNLVFGRSVDSNGVLTEGEFKDGKLNGIGLKVNDTLLRKGTFLNGKQHGMGFEECKEFTYEGEFLDDQKSGKGKYKFKILDETYEGESLHDQITGFGVYTWANKNRYEGFFLNMKMHGKGKYYWPDGAEYEGDYIENIKTGKGKFKWSDGKSFEGEFDKGLPHGKGILTLKNSTQFEAIFEEGQLKSKIPISKAK